MMKHDQDRIMSLLALIFEDETDEDDVTLNEVSPDHAAAELRRFLEHYGTQQGSLDIPAGAKTVRVTFKAEIVDSE